MSDSLRDSSDEKLAETLEANLVRYFPANCRIERLQRIPVITASTCGLEHVDIQLAGGDRISLIVKDLSPQGMLVESRQVRPSFVIEPRREIFVYEQILRGRKWGTAGCFGSSVSTEKGRHWLLLEPVVGVELYQIGEMEIWIEAARWLARMHADLASIANSTESAASVLLNYDARLFQVLADRACDSLSRVNSPKALRVRTWIQDRYQRVIDYVADHPRTMVHGEYYASNILVRSDRSQERICPIDWELAGWGCGLIDVAALIAGSWSEPDKERLALAYYRDAITDPNGTMSAEFRSALHCCRLHIALQWLGWSERWKPPSQHAYDWLAEAEAMIDQLTV